MGSSVRYSPGPQKMPSTPRSGLPRHYSPGKEYRTPVPVPLDTGELSALKSLSLRARMLSDALGLGCHRSLRRGGDVEFADYRDYQPGDDLKRIDWRLFARTDRLHVRRAHADTPMKLVLLLDTSKSMEYSGAAGRLTKLDYSRALLGALALLARGQRDLCGVGLLGEDLVAWQPPGASAQRLEAVWGILDTPQRGQGTDLSRALDMALTVAPRRCFFVVASDFYVGPEALDPVFKRVQAEGHEMLALRVLDPVEVDLDLSSPGEFWDIETGETMVSDPAALGDDYRKALERHNQALEANLAEIGGDFLSLRTDTLPLEALRTYLGKRGHTH